MMEDRGYGRVIGGGIRVHGRHVDQPPPLAHPCKLARWLFRQRDGFVAWDTETTGLGDDARIVSIGAVDQDGNVLLDLMLNPEIDIPGESSEIHGITDEMVSDAPTFEQAYPQIRDALGGRRWVIYNAGYDVLRLWHECDRAYLPRIEALSTAETGTHYQGKWGTIERPERYCAMEAFAVHYGAWSDYHESYTWQSLSTAAEYYRVSVEGAHNALADAKMTLQVLKCMAFDEDWNDG